MTECIRGPHVPSCRIIGGGGGGTEGGGSGERASKRDSRSGWAGGWRGPLSVTSAVGAGTWRQAESGCALGWGGTHPGPGTTYPGEPPSPRDLVQGEREREKKRGMGQSVREPPRLGARLRVRLRLTPAVGTAWGIHEVA